jgi:hypothetical protein
MHFVERSAKRQAFSTTHTTCFRCATKYERTFLNPDDFNTYIRDKKISGEGVPDDADVDEIEGGLFFNTTYVLNKNKDKEQMMSKEPNEEPNNDQRRMWISKRTLEDCHVGEPNTR